MTTNGRTSVYTLVEQGARPAYSEQMV